MTTDPLSASAAIPVAPVRCGLRAGGCAVLPEEADWFRSLLGSLLARLKPADAAAANLVEAMAVLELKLVRLDAMELRLLAGETGEGAARPPSLHTLAGYRARLLKERWDMDHRLRLLAASRDTNEAEASDRQARIDFLESWAAKVLATAGRQPAGARPSRAHRQKRRPSRRRRPIGTSAGGRRPGCAGRREIPGSSAADAAPPAGQVAVERSRADLQPPRHLGHADAGIAQQRPRRLQVALAEPRGRPPLRPRARAASSPARVRSPMTWRSNSANAAKMWKTSRPPEVVVSTASVSERSPTPPASSRSTVAISCRSERASRSSRQTASVSPGRRKSSAAASCGRSRCAPDAVSV